MRHGRLAWVARTAWVAGMAWVAGAAWVGSSAFIAGCYSSEGPGPAPGPARPDCVDEDGDGYGDGLDCVAPDCDDADASRALECAASCDDEPTAPGCVCAGEPAPIACYEGPEGTANVGPCSTGLRRCIDGAWSACEGQVLPAEESCNRTDDDCDGMPDDGAMTACGDCDHVHCVRECVGVGCEPFVPGEGTALAADGALIVTGRDVTPRQIWVTSPAFGTVTRIDTDWLEVTGRFRTGPEGDTYPVAVAMNDLGDVFVVDTHGGTRSKELSLILSSACPDLDGDGTVESSGSDETLDWGEDECVGWQVDLEDCDGEGFCGNGAGIALTEEGRRAWVSATEARSIIEVDIEEGELTGRRVDLSGAPLGIVADARGSLWATGNEDRLYRIPLDDLEDRESFGLRDTATTINLDIDDEGRIAYVSPLGIYDPSSGEYQSAGWQAWDVAVGVDGSLWAADARTLRRYDPDSFEFEWFEADNPTQIAIDLAGNVWTLDPTGGTLTIHDSAGERIGTLLDDCEDGPWDGSGCAVQGTLEGDPTGIRVRRAFGAGSEAELRHVFAPDCPDANWRDLYWQAEGGEVELAVRAAYRLEDLAASAWVDVGSTPPDSGTASLGGVLEPASLLEVRAILRGPVTRLIQIAVTMKCNWWNP